MVKCYTGGIWSKEVEEKMLQYVFVKKVFLDIESKNTKEVNLISKIEKLLGKEDCKNSEEFDRVLANNKIFKLDKEVDFYIRRICYHFQEEKIIIDNCVIMFLSNKENELLDFLNNFKSEVKIGKVNIKFPEAKFSDTLRDSATNIIKEALENSAMQNINENNLIHFFNDKTVVYSNEIKFAEIRTLIDAGKNGNPFIIPKIRGILAIFISNEELPIGTVSNTMQDINFYVGARKNTDSLVDVKIDKNCKEPKIKLILAS